MNRKIAVCILNAAICAAAGAAGVSSGAIALPTLSGLAETVEALQSRTEERLAETTNAVAEAKAQALAAQSGLLATNLRIDEQADLLDRMLILVEGDKGLRERWHGGKIGTYVVTNESGRLIKVDLYFDETCWTNGTTSPAPVAIKDPEKHARELAEAAERAEQIRQAWERANLPPDLAELRARQREIERQNAASRAEEEGL